MATPAGYIDAAAGGWLVEKTETVDATWIPMDFFNQLAPPAWSQSLKRERVDLYWQVTIPNDSTELTIQAPFNYMCGASEHTTSGAGWAGAWEEMDEFGTITPAVQTYPGFSGFGIESKRPAHSAAPAAYVYTDDSDCEVLTLAFATYHQDAYADSTPAGSGNLEHCGRNTDADSWRPYDKQEPASAWLAKRVISQTLNRIIYRSRGDWSVPL